MTLANQLAAFCIDSVEPRLTPAALHACRRALLDFCGVALAGSTMVPSDVMRRAVMPGMGIQQGGLIGSVIGTDRSIWAPMAALLNGASAHSIELDDLHAEASLHPSAIVFPAALALAEATGCDGRRFIKAAAAGFEAVIRVGLWITPSEFYKRAFHPTGVAGVFGATAAAAVILDLSADQLARAFGIASDLSTGLMEFGQSGSWSKRMHTGWPAHAGCVAALLAGEGFLGSDQVFEGPNGVIFAGAGRTEPVAAAVPGADEPMGIERIAFKRHACCRFAHTALDILTDLKLQHGLAPDDVESVTIGLFRDGMFLAEPADRKRAPETMVDAQFSLQYSAAAVLVRGRASLPEFLDDCIRDPGIRALAQRITVEHRSELDAMFPQRYPSDVALTTRSGQVFRDARDNPVGDITRPLDDSQLREKFEMLAQFAVPPERVRHIAAAIDAVFDTGSPASLAQALRVSQSAGRA